MGSSQGINIMTLRDTRDRVLKQRAFSVLAKIARSLRGYVFHFDLSSKTLNTLNREMELW